MSKDHHYSPHRSSIIDMDANIMSVLAYVLPAVLGFIPIVWHVAWLVPIIMFFMEKNSNLVKFHALQSIFLHIARAIILEIASWIFLIGGLLSWLISLAFFIIAIIAILGAYSYKETHIPFIGDFVESIIK